MQLPKELTTVTPLSKYLALFLFITLPILSFYCGMKYQEKLHLGEKSDITANLNAENNEKENIGTYKDLGIEQVEIIEGNIYSIKPDNQKELIIDKANMAPGSITSIKQVSISPDNTKMCFVGLAPIPSPRLYYALIDGSSIVEVGPGENCSWSYDSQQIAFNNHVTDISPINILIYDLKLGTTQNVTSRITPYGKIRFYQKPIWTNETTVGAIYTENDPKEGTYSNEQFIKIDVSSGRVIEEL